MIINFKNNKTQQFKHTFSKSLNPIEIDVGCSHGDFLTNIAAEYPTRIFFGIEIVSEKCHIAESKIKKAGVSNVFIINAEAKQFISGCIPSNCVNSIHIYFPSPYPNRDLNLEHRLITNDFLYKIYSILKPGGSLRIVTDHKGYFSQINNLIRNNQKWWPINWIPPYKNIPNNYIVGTHWEIKLTNFKVILYIQILK